jgi:hypothetical protein
VRRTHGKRKQHGAQRCIHSACNIRHPAVRVVRRTRVVPLEYHWSTRVVPLAYPCSTPGVAPLSASVVQQARGRSHCQTGGAAMWPAMRFMRPRATCGPGIPTSGVLYSMGSVQCGSGPALQSPDPRAWEPYPTMPHGIALSMVCPVSQVTLGRAFFYGRAADEKVQARHICPRPRLFCPRLGRILRRYNVQDILAPGRASPAVSRGQMWPSRGRGANGRTARCVLWLSACRGRRGVPF